MDNKRQVFVGVSLVGVAFLGIIAIFYILVNSQEQKVRRIEFLQEEVSVLDTEIDLAKRKSEELEGALGESVYLDKLIKEAEKTYDQEERNRREGSLWIDRKANTIVATLGAINGVFPGTQLAVYDDDNKQIGHVTVETPMDIISYIKPTNFLLNQFERDYFRIVLEE